MLTVQMPKELITLQEVDKDNFFIPRVVTDDAKSGLREFLKQIINQVCFLAEDDYDGIQIVNLEAKEIYNCTRAYCESLDLADKLLVTEVKKATLILE